MKTRSVSRERRLKRKRNKSGSGSKYSSSSEDRLSSEKSRRRRSPSSPPYRYGSSYRESSRSPRERERHSSSSSYRVLCVSALHSRASDEVVKEILHNEYKKYGDFTVRISRDGDERVAYINFANSEDAKEAKAAKPRVIIYDKIALVDPVYERGSPERHRSHRRSRSYSPGYDRYRRSPPVPDYLYRDRLYDRIPYPPIPIPPRDFGRELPIHPDFLPRPPLHPGLPPPHLPLPPLYGLPPRPFFPFKPFPPFFDKFDKRERFPNYLQHIPPEEDPLATRTLFVGNLELGVSDEELRRIFGQHGVVEDVDIKRPMVPNTGNAYAFVRFKNLDMAHKAKVEVSGQFIGKYQCKIGYGKATPTTRIWVGGLGPFTSVAQLEREFDRFGAIKKIDIEKGEQCAYILYDNIESAASAIREMRGYPLGGSDHKLRVDYADLGSRSFKSHNEESTSTADYKDKVKREGYYDPYDPWNAPEYGYKSRKSRSREKEREKRSSRSPTPSRSRSRSRSRGRKRSRSRSGSRSRANEVLPDRMSPESIIAVRTFSELSRKSLPCWRGALLLKHSVFPADFYIIEGDKDIIPDVSENRNDNFLRITQRLRLDQTKMDDVAKRLSSATSYAIFLGLSGTGNKNDSGSLQTRPLKNLTSYLKQKDAAGVISLYYRDLDMNGVLYAFPPCEFSTDLIRRTARNMSDESFRDDHLVVVVVKGEQATGDA